MEPKLAKNSNALSQREQSWDEIKMTYPDEWVLVGNPVKKESEYFITSGIPLHHSSDKRQLCIEGNQILENLGLENFKVVYTGEIHSSGHFMTGIFNQLL